MIGNNGKKEEAESLYWAQSDEAWVNLAVRAKNISDRFRPVPGSLSRCTATLHLGAPGQTRAFGEGRGQLSRGEDARRGGSGEKN